MSCPEDRISAWMDGELAQPEASAVETHVARCTSCQEMVSSLRNLSTLFEMDVTPDPGFIHRFREHRDELSVAPWWTWRQLALRLVPVAAAVLVAAIVTLWMLPTLPPLDGSLQALEREALGAPVAFESEAEPVLRIAFEPFPQEIE